jgi:hypothetical protein
MPINMGMGKLGDGKIIHKRKFRWTFEVQRQPFGNNVPASFVKVAARPNLNIEETEINFLNAKRFLPGKGTWETITVTYYDIAGDASGTSNIGLWDWLASVYDYTGSGSVVGVSSPEYISNPDVKQSSRRECYSGTGVIGLYDGCGNALERWTLNDCWPQSINFGELDYSSSEEATIEVTIRYQGVTYRSFCDSNPITPNCCGCPNPSGSYGPTDINR